MGMENYNPPQEPWLVILYQDDHIMVVNKPSGLLSVPGRLEEHKDSVMTRIQRDYPQAESVHRLDMATSGVIVVALTKAAERELKRQFREREPKKQYVARVWGHPSPAEGLVDLPLICDWPNRPYVNRFALLYLRCLRVGACLHRYTARKAYLAVPAVCYLVPVVAATCQYHRGGCHCHK